MPTEHDKTPTDGDEPVGNIMAAQLLENMVMANENSKKTQKLLASVNDKIDELCGYFECFSNAMGVLADIKETKKTKLTSDDFVSAWATAEEETFPDDGEDDEDGDEDPRVPDAPEPVGGPRRI